MDADTASDPISVAAAALAGHDRDCSYCATPPGAAACAERLELKAAWRRAVRGGQAGEVAR